MTSFFFSHQPLHEKQCELEEDFDPITLSPVGQDDFDEAFLQHGYENGDDDASESLLLTICHDLLHCPGEDSNIEQETSPHATVQEDKDWGKICEKDHMRLTDVLFEVAESYCQGCGREHPPSPCTVLDERLYWENMTEDVPRSEAPRHCLVKPSNSSLISSTTSVEKSSPPPITTTASKRAADDTIAPTSRDVLCGKGGKTADHNRFFLHLCATYSLRYVQTKKRGLAGKKGFVLKVIHAVRAQGGRFLKQSAAGVWEEVSDEKAAEKVGHCMRDCAYRYFDESHLRL